MRKIQVTFEKEKMLNADLKNGEINYSILCNSLAGDVFTIEAVEIDGFEVGRYTPSTPLDYEQYIAFCEMYQALKTECEDEMVLLHQRTFESEENRTKILNFVKKFKFYNLKQPFIIYMGLMEIGKEKFPWGFIINETKFWETELPLCI